MATTKTKPATPKQPTPEPVRVVQIIPAPDDNCVDIDKNRLDWEIERQPKLMRREADLLTNTRRDLDEAKLAVKIAEVQFDKVQAQIKLKIRKDPEGYGLPPRCTEAGVEEAMTVQPEIDQAQDLVWAAERKVIRLKEQVGHHENVVEALRQKKDGLQDEVKLWGWSYFARPSTREESGGSYSQRRSGFDGLANQQRGDSYDG